MDYNYLKNRNAQFSRKGQIQDQLPYQPLPISQENSYRFSQPKTRIAMIKINKSKLPLDFFPKTDLSHKKISLKISLKDQKFDHLSRNKRADSFREHASPEKTSFFGFFEDVPQEAVKKLNLNTKFLNRKFETRQEIKRESIQMDGKRKLTPAAKSIKNDLHDLFPSTCDEMSTEVVISSNRTKSIKFGRKEQLSKYLDQHLSNNQNTLFSGISEFVGPLTSRMNPEIIPKAHTMNLLPEKIQEMQMLNMTFCNMKSSCLPPISKKQVNS